MDKLEVEAAKPLGIVHFEALLCKTGLLFATSHQAKLRQAFHFCVQLMEDMIIPCWKVL
jgi:hypothetical protein